MTTLIEGTESHVHDFDGCMYGLATHYGHRNIPIKKPWRIVSWGVQFQNLMKKCDHKHQHAPCAGRETRVTQLYTLRIAQHMIETLNKRALSLWKKQHVASRAPVLYDWSRSPHPSMSNGNHVQKSISIKDLTRSFSRFTILRRRNSLVKTTMTLMIHAPVSLPFTIILSKI